MEKNINNNNNINNNTKIPQMENIQTTAAIFHMPVYSIRQLVLSGRVPAIRVGRRIFVNVDGFSEYLNTCTLTSAADEAPCEGRIGPIGR